MAGSIKEMFEKNPEQFGEFMEKANYADLLKFIKTAYKEYRDTKDAAAEYAFFAAMAQIPLDKRIDLALDFSFQQDDIPVNEAVANLVVDALSKGVKVDDATLKKLSKTLKAQLSKIKTAKDETYRYVSSLVDALVLAGDDAGLNVMLTESDIIKNYMRKDSWNAESEAVQFKQLSDKYKKLGDEEDKKADEEAWSVPERTWSAFYLLCQKRREAGRPILAEKPIVNLDKLLKSDSVAEKK